MPTTPTLWEKTKQTSKSGFDKTWKALDKLGAPVNRLSNKLGSEAFWPTTLDKESEKCARILRSFCKDGFYADEKATADTPSGKQRVVKKIPAEVIRKAKGLAIFTTMRTGLWISGAGGSGVVVARKEDGSWSEPSGILLHTAGLGWLVGVDIYDCVLVLNTQKAVDAFTRLRWTVGGEISAVAGPVGVGGVMETELHKRQAPVFQYMKSRGFYAGVQVDGTVVIERNDENERFYREKISGADILKGKIRHLPFELEMLRETLKAAQGDTFDESKVAQGPAPADNEIEKSDAVWGVPDKEDPDPFGLLALKASGLTLNDAATHEPVAETELEQEFVFQPSQKSPIFTTYHHGRSASASLASLDGAAPRSSLDAATQTEGMTSLSKELPTKPVRRGPLPALPPRLPLRPKSVEKQEPDSRIVMEDEEAKEKTPKSAGLEERETAVSSQFDDVDLTGEPIAVKQESQIHHIAETVDVPTVDEKGVVQDEPSFTDHASALEKGIHTKTTESESAQENPEQVVNNYTNEHDKHDSMPGAFS